MKIQSLIINNLNEIRNSVSNEIWNMFEKHVEENNNFFATLDAEYIWKFESDVALKSRLQKLTNIGDINKLVWSDVLTDIEAAEQIFYRRTNAILNSTIHLLQKGDYLSSATLLRSFLELIIWNVYHSATFDVTIRSINQSHKKYLINPEELQDCLVKLIFGTNLKGVELELKQHNVIKICGKIAKAVKSDTRQEIDLEKVYDLLCEYVHPNAGGNNLFLNFDINARKKPISLIEIMIREKQNSEKEENPCELVLTALNWCLPARIFASQKYTNSRRMIIEKFELHLKNSSTIH